MYADSYRELSHRLAKTLPESNLIEDPLRTLVYGRDASFYSLVPKLVVKISNEAEVVALLRQASDLHTPLTFRAAGTSLSGQAVSDSVLAVLGPTWNHHRILDGGTRVALQPGIIGGYANGILAPFGRKIGPDPASIDSAMIGGIAANNASGMCCGTAENSYRTLSSMRLILADGSLLDTGDPASMEAFRTTHRAMIERVRELSHRVQSNSDLASRIRRKYKMKNTTGYSLNALVDFEDPLEIIQHLLIGSEGTLGFIAEITYRTVPELPYKASALLLFPDIAGACDAVGILKGQPVAAVELMDRASLRSVEGKPGMPDYLTSLDERVGALLVETRAEESDRLAGQISSIGDALAQLPLSHPSSFTSDASEFNKLWGIRKGLFPSVGAMRRSGTTVIIEDVAFPVPRLAQATKDLRSLFRKHGYDEAIIFGHALEGNLHFVFAQDFNVAAEVDRYASFIEDVTSMVVGSYDGSLKAEHGTGRNMAPFVEREWGREAYALMHEIKQIFDPANILNPGVILNADSRIHLKNLKPLPEADPIVDKCIECGFCEVHCPSRNLTLTPRQRIAAYREITRRKNIAGIHPNSHELRKAFKYDGDATCATDGLCATNCPVGIDTGRLIKHLRSANRSQAARAIASFVAGHMGFVTAGMRVALDIVYLKHRLLGTSIMENGSRILRSLSGDLMPLWNRWMPRGAPSHTPWYPQRAGRPSVVYVPSCINRVMGIVRGSTSELSLTAVIADLLDRADYNVIYPDRLSSLCCGMAFASKGFEEQGRQKAGEMEQALRVASHQWQYPVLMDMSPCFLRMKETFESAGNIYEPVEFAQKFLTDRLKFSRIPGPVAIHATCSTIKLGREIALLDLARRCADQVIVPEGVECCGWAGDRGFTVPELNASALSSLKDRIPPDCRQGYSTSRTCEIGLSLHSGIEYRSILYLVEECTRRGEERSETVDRGSNVDKG